MVQSSAPSPNFVGLRCLCCLSSRLKMCSIITSAWAQNNSNGPLVAQLTLCRSRLVTWNKGTMRKISWHQMQRLKHCLLFSSLVLNFAQSVKCLLPRRKYPNIMSKIIIDYGGVTSWFLPQLDPSGIPVSPQCQQRITNLHQGAGDASNDFVTSARSESFQKRWTTQASRSIEKR